MGVLSSIAWFRFSNASTFHFINILWSILCWTHKPVSCFTGKECVCRDWHGCIMQQKIVGQDNIQPYRFSECSLRSYINTIRDDLDKCLLNKPNEVMWLHLVQLLKKDDEWDSNRCRPEHDLGDRTFFWASIFHHIQNAFQSLTIKNRSQERKFMAPRYFNSTILETEYEEKLQTQLPQNTRA